MPLDPDKVAAIMREVAESELLPRFRALAQNEVWEKQRGGTVTVADLESERRLDELLRDLVPGSVVLAEEFAETNPDAVVRLTEDLPVWIVDPLDGTKNFAQGKDDFAIIVAYYSGGAVRGGWILAPCSGRLVSAEEGAGAWCNNEVLKLSPAKSLDFQTGFLGNRTRRKNEAFNRRFKRLVNFRCRGIEYMALASGDLDFAHYRSLKPWDHAAGDLIVREAGGYSAGFDSGARYNPAQPDYNGLLIAGDKSIWLELLDLLRPTVMALD